MTLHPDKPAACPSQERHAATASTLLEWLRTCSGIRGSRLLGADGTVPRQKKITWSGERQARETSKVHRGSLEEVSSKEGKLVFDGREVMILCSEFSQLFFAYRDISCLGEAIGTCWGEMSCYIQGKRLQMSVRLVSEHSFIGVHTSLFGPRSGHGSPKIMIQWIADCCKTCRRAYISIE